jgi:two-component system, OmpR family, sensor histidine kinase TctE
MARPEAASLRARVFQLAVLLLVGAAGLLFAFINDYAGRAADRAFDRLLSASALTIAGAVVVEDSEVVLEVPASAFAMVAGQERVFYAVVAPGGRHVTGYSDLGVGQPLAVSDHPVFADTAHNGEPVRLVSVGRLISTDAGAGWVTVRVAETRGEREALATEILGNAVAPILALTLLALGLVWVVLGRALAPLSVIDRALRQRSADDLSPIDVPVPAEVQRLVSGLNGFMQRLGLSSARLAGLVAEAAHQVRNPLASLRAQSELAIAEPDEAQLRARVARIHDGAVEASHLVSQLLMDATISHRMDAIEARPVSVAALVDEVIDRLDPDLRSRVGLARGPETDAAVVQGDPVALREMLRNLIDNAMAYSDGPVEIAVGAPAADTIRLAVRDRGPGSRPTRSPACWSASRGATGSRARSARGWAWPSFTAWSRGTADRLRFWIARAGASRSSWTCPLRERTQAAGARPQPRSWPSRFGLRWPGRQASRPWRRGPCIRRPGPKPGVW